MEVDHVLVQLGLLLAVGACIGANEWSYRDPDGPSTWYKRYPACNGSRQSPVDLQHEVTVFEKALSDMKFEFETSVPARLRNDGKTIRIIIDSSNSKMQGKELDGTFRSFEGHFHWGSTNSQGSEHWLNGESSAMEINILHYNEKYASPSEAMTQNDGLAVVGVLVDVQVTTNPAVQAVVEVLGNLTYNGSEASIPSFPLDSLLPAERSRLYHYHGSLTTPGCSENVKWFVFEKTIQISALQVQAFRNLSAVGPMAAKRVRLEDNFRPVQPLNGRTVARSFDNPNGQCVTEREYVSICSKLAGDKDVSYTVEVDPCTRPVTVWLAVDVPDAGFGFRQRYVSDAGPIPIGNLDYGVQLEFHSHPDGPNAGKLHLFLYLHHPLSNNSQRSEVLDEFYEIDGASCPGQAVKCSSESSWDEQWCEKTNIGYDSDVFFIGYELTAKDVCKDSPSVSVKFYRKTSSELHWTWAAVHTFSNGKQEDVHLTGHIVHNPQQTALSGEQTQTKRDTPESKWEYMKFEAKIQKSGNQVDFMLLLTPTGLRYKVLHAVFVHDADMCKPSSGGLSSGSKAAIGVTVALVLAAIIGLTFGCLYYKRKKYFGRRQALVEEVDGGDINIDDNKL